jgi:hypothetical protein
MKSPLTPPVPRGWWKKINFPRSQLKPGRRLRASRRNADNCQSHTFRRNKQAATTQRGTPLRAGQKGDDANAPFLSTNIKQVPIATTSYMLYASTEVDRIGKNINCGISHSKLKATPIRQTNFAM